METKFCENCGEKIDKKAEICPECGVRVKKGSKKNPALAFVLSFIWVGLGQMYNGEFGKGIILMILAFISVLLFSIGIGAITYLIIWILGMHDAYKIAEES